MSTGCKSSHSVFLNVSRSNGGLRISGWIGQLSCLAIFSTSLSVAAFLRRAGSSMLESTGSHGRDTFVYCFTRQLYSLFFENLIMGSRLKIVISLYDASTTFNVAVKYLQCKHLATFAQSWVYITHENSHFPHQQK